MAVNNSGQVLIKSVSEIRDGKPSTYPVIWDHGVITKLKGLEGDLGIESEESYGFDMNNKGEVVGQSLTSLVYKNNVYYQVHAVKWVDGQAIDLHKTVAKASKSHAFVINDNGDFIVEDGAGGRYASDKEGKVTTVTWMNDNVKMNNSRHMFNNRQVCNFNASYITNLVILNKTIASDKNSIWMRANRIVCVNDNKEIIAEGETIYGEKHAMLLTPASSE